MTNSFAQRIKHEELFCIYLKTKTYKIKTLVLRKQLMNETHCLCCLTRVYMRNWF